MSCSQKSRKIKIRKKLTRVYEPLTLNRFMILTKYGKHEIKDSATLFSRSEKIDT